MTHRFKNKNKIADVISSMERAELFIIVLVNQEILAEGNMWATSREHEENNCDRPTADKNCRC
jgi:disulfide oxidoreductase YuzD